VKLGLNWPMGPLRLLDYVGLDTTLAMMKIFQKELGDVKFQPCPLLEQMVKAGLLGRKSGKGFYEWKKK
jgi:3-hydroxybutyryl-CoA dehydrogenase